MPRVVVLASARAASAAVADFLARLLAATPDLVLALPAGRTPIALYEALVVCHRQGRADFRQASAFGLDEFDGLRPRDPRSFHTFLRTRLLDRVNIPASRIHALNGAAADWRKEADAYESRIAAAGGIDLAIVGIGRNGHIGFNEPGSHLAARTHRVRLRPETRRGNAPAFGGNWRDVPPYAISMGMGTIMNARAIILLAFGQQKATIVRRAIDGPITTQLPASLLQLHPNATVVLDKEAANTRGKGPQGP